MSEILVESHPNLLVRAFYSTFPTPIGELHSPETLVGMLSLNATTGLQRSEELRGAVRDVLRHGGYKPTGRGKPASEYLVRTAEEGGIRSINAAVDACNVVSLHSGFPISVVDVDRAVPPFRIAIAPKGATYVFNPAGQEIDIGGLLCLFDSDGPCANAVKDSQRTKTHDGTTRTLSVIWGSSGFESQLDAANDRYQDLIRSLGASVDPASVRM
jgi:DNA/RNA-binding domain of Phe-tRNA-synthetase-like protein